jgi:type IV secretory pathway VirB10-like protein
VYREPAPLQRNSALVPERNAFILAFGVRADQTPKQYITHRVHLVSFGDWPMSSARIYFAGMATTILLLGIGFSGGLMLARTAMEPGQQNRPTVANRSAPDRVVLPASAEAHPAPPQPAAPADPPAATERPAVPIQAKDVQGSEKNRQAEFVEQRKAESAERERRRNYAERKARREAARLKRERDQQEARGQERTGVMAFSFDESKPRPGGFFGN